MKNLFARIGLFLILLTSLNLQVAFADFPDVKMAHKNYKAITYLQENGVINGYPDGTFKPENSVNRAEFLKIIIEGSKIFTDAQTETPFPDVDHSAWYGPYLKKAYAEGWIDGYPDGTFKPEQTINKVEALKVLGKVQNWQTEESIETAPFEDTPTSEWYIKYVSFAKDHNYLEETGSVFEPGSLMSRANISEIIYRTLIEKELTEEPEEPIEEPATEDPINEPDEPVIEDEPEPEPEDEPEPEEEEPVIEANFTPVAYKTISKSFFDNITLTDDLPNIFYKNEVYIVEGDVTSGDTATVILNGTTVEGDDSSFSAEAENGHFIIPVYFNKEGNYNLGIIPASSGTTKAQPISVLSNLPASNNTESIPTAAGSLSVSYQNDKTTTSFISSTDAVLNKIVFTQNTKTVEYVNRQNLNAITVNYPDFENFKAENVSYNIETAALSSAKPLEISSDFKASASQTFQAVEHTFDLIDEEKITANPVDTMTSPGTILFSGTVKTDTKLPALVIKPSGLVDEFDLSTTSATSTSSGTTLINNGGNFTFTYIPSGTGTFILEINDKNGEATLNHPVYIGSGIPLIPDFLDLNERELFSGTFNLTTLRNEWLNAINQARQDHGFNTITMADEINTVAQGHTDDMAANNFFAHVNLQGKTPDDRRIAGGVKTAVSENIAKDTGIAAGHYGLMRSAAHRQNILDPNWTRVGLGVTLSEGHLLLAQEFSTSEITAQNLIDYKTELLSEINQVRQNAAMPTLNSRTDLDQAGQYINDKVIDEGAALTNALFNEALGQYGITGSSQLIGRTHDSWQDILDSILTSEQSTLIQSTWLSMGIDLQLDSTGIIHATVILNSNSL